MATAIVAFRVAFLIASFAWPITFSVFGYLKPSRWLLMALGFAFIAVPAFVLSLAWTRVEMQVGNAPSAQSYRDVGYYVMGIMILTAASSLGCVFAAALHRPKSLKNL